MERRSISVNITMILKDYFLNNRDFRGESILLVIFLNFIYYTFSIYLNILEALNIPAEMKFVKKSKRAAAGMCDQSLGICLNHRL